MSLTTQVGVQTGTNRLPCLPALALGTTKGVSGFLQSSHLRVETWKSSFLSLAWMAQGWWDRDLIPGILKG